MSDIKQIALSAAIQARNPDASAEEIVNCAEIFEAYIAGSETVKPPVALLLPAKTAAKVEKPAKVEKEVEQPKAPVGPTLQDIKDKVNELLQANLREQAIALFASYNGAKNASGVPATAYADFIAKADEILMKG